LFFPAFIVVIAQHNDRRNSEAEQNVKERLHFVRLSVIGEIARENKNVGLVMHSLKLVFELGMALWIEVQIGCGCYSHASLNIVMPGPTTRRAAQFRPIAGIPRNTQPVAGGFALPPRGGLAIPTRSHRWQTCCYPPGCRETALVGQAVQPHSAAAAVARAKLPQAHSATVPDTHSGRARVTTKASPSSHLPIAF